jgi:hypothetical protein
MSYKVIYHNGEEISVKTKVKTGRLSLSESLLTVTGRDPFCIPISSLQSVDLFRLHGLGRMLRIVHNRGTFFVSVVRFCLFGQFAIINFFGTGKLKDELIAAISNAGHA